jgi:site-specific recombinase XerD
MASISSDPSGNRTVQFFAGDGKRRSIRIGKFDMKSAREIARRIEELNNAKIAGLVIDRNTAEWLSGIADVLHQKIAAAGLVASREVRAEAPTLEKFIENFLAKRAVAAPTTLLSMRISAKRLIEYFGADTRIDKIGEGDADDWLLWLTHEKKYARATIGRTVKRARQFFRPALRRHLIDKNPFADIKAPSQKNEARKHFVTQEVAYRVIDACPDLEWKLIFALSRFGGLRCPSEHLALGWQDVNWEQDRFLVRSPKKNDERWVPIFPELRPFLAKAFDAAPEGAVHVITKRRPSAQRWGMLLGRILAKAGIEPWERIFHNLRASRETELSAIYPIAAVCRWLGNSAKVADDHYLMALERDFEKAAEFGALQNPVQQTATNGDFPPQTITENSAETLEIAGNAGNSKKFPEACKSQGG